MTMFGRAAPAGRARLWAVWVLLGLTAGPFLLAWASPDVRHFLFSFFAIVDIGNRSPWPWSVLTYPLASPGMGNAALFIALSCFWLYNVASSLEGDLGGGLLMGVYGVGTLLHGLIAVIAAPLRSDGLEIFGFDLPLAFLTLVWCGRNTGVVIRLFGIVPLSGLVLGILVTVLTVLAYGSGFGGMESRTAPLFGLTMAIPLALAWFYGQDKLPLRYGRMRRTQTSTKTKQKEFDAFIGNVRDREREREERERLRKLFEDSLDDK